ncbi:L-threonylcarbamoyladenylate synthase [Candidatus Puniceispirillum sp.]|jgi:L-threonylcarbamoyladenylate synthase|uniref:L-threonylcarbamoyladenylate synthase n=1 Tax=Candidatus Puniceispirillum sp. TaxID=2026719 RepID=UPI001EBD81D0|nr:threonylcarbamoyl-AMP synthase [Candidatus Puniceispirillum sp.]MBT6565575.1 threonylcarbamoyl-AMP synthase [Candidatus Puniceispirillum sp.]
MTECLLISDHSLARAVDVLRDGRLVAFPTETVYGLGGDACNAHAVASIFATKGRPSFNPLISHVSTSDAAFKLGKKTALAECLASHFWPGAMTLILDRSADCMVSMLTTAGLSKIAVRVPSHPAASQLLTAFDGPLAAPSANPSGRISPSMAGHVLDGLGGHIDLVLDGGACQSGLESTIVDCSSDIPVILRPGGITRDAINDALEKAGHRLLGQNTASKDENKPISPGQLASHYAPQLGVRMNAETAEHNEIAIGFGTQISNASLNLSKSGNITEAAANLFALLHKADKLGGEQNAERIAIAAIPNEGLGEAINDRLRRAAAPR